MTIPPAVAVGHFLRFAYISVSGFFACVKDISLKAISLQPLINVRSRSDSGSFGISHWPRMSIRQRVTVDENKNS